MSIPRSRCVPPRRTPRPVLVTAGCTHTVAVHERAGLRPPQAPGPCRPVCLSPPAPCGTGMVRQTHVYSQCKCDSRMESAPVPARNRGTAPPANSRRSRHRRHGPMKAREPPRRHAQDARIPASPPGATTRRGGGWIRSKLRATDTDNPREISAPARQLGYNRAPLSGHSRAGLPDDDDSRPPSPRTGGDRLPRARGAGRGCRRGRLRAGCGRFRARDGHPGAHRGPRRGPGAARRAPVRRGAGAAAPDDVGTGGGRGRALSPRPERDRGVAVAPGGRDGGEEGAARRGHRRAARHARPAARPGAGAPGAGPGVLLQGRGRPRARSL